MRYDNVFPRLCCAPRRSMLRVWLRGSLAQHVRTNSPTIACGLPLLKSQNVSGDRIGWESSFLKQPTLHGAPPLCGAGTASLGRCVSIALRSVHAPFTSERVACTSCARILTPKIPWFYITAQRLCASCLAGTHYCSTRAQYDILHSADFRFHPIKRRGFTRASPAINWA